MERKSSKQEKAGVHSNDSNRVLVYTRMITNTTKTQIPSSFKCYLFVIRILRDMRENDNEGYKDFVKLSFDFWQYSDNQNMRQFYNFFFGSMQQSEKQQLFDSVIDLCQKCFENDDEMLFADPMQWITEIFQTLNEMFFFLNVFCIWLTNIMNPNHTNISINHQQSFMNSTNCLLNLVAKLPFIKYSYKIWLTLLQYLYFTQFSNTSGHEYTSVSEFLQRRPSLYEGFVATYHYMRNIELNTEKESIQSEGIIKYQSTDYILDCGQNVKKPNSVRSTSNDIGIQGHPLLKKLEHIDNHILQLNFAQTISTEISPETEQTLNDTYNSLRHIFEVQGKSLQFQETEFYKTKYCVIDTVEFNHDLEIDFENVESCCSEILNSWLKSEVESILDSEYITNGSITPNSIDNRSTGYNYILSGSAADGFWSARWFLAENIGEVETDIMHEIGCYSKKWEFLFQPIKGKDLFLSVISNPIHERLFAENLKKKVSMRKIGTSSGYLSSLQFRRYIWLSCFKTKGSEMHHNMRRVLIQMLERDLREKFNFSQINIESFNITNGNVALTFNIVVSDGCFKYRINFDYVPVLKLQFWPICVQGWLQKSSLWLSNEKRREIAKLGCHLAPKSSQTSENTAQEDIEWRLSFSIAEREIMKCFNTNQRVVFYLFKALFYKYVYKIGVENCGAEAKSDVHRDFHSYFIKTVMFWVCERYPPQNDEWSDIIGALKTVLLTFHEMLSTKELPHFFIPTWNLIAKVSEENIKNALHVTGKMAEHTLWYIPFDLKDIKVVMEGLPYSYVPWVLRFVPKWIKMQKLENENDILDILKVSTIDFFLQ